MPKANSFPRLKCVLSITDCRSNDFQSCFGFWYQSLWGFIDEESIKSILNCAFNSSQECAPSSWGFESQLSQTHKYLLFLLSTLWMPSKFKSCSTSPGACPARTWGEMQQCHREGHHPLLPSLEVRNVHSASPSSNICESSERLDNYLTVI